jgi:hypothetical protein
MNYDSKVEEFFSLLEGSKPARAASPFRFHSEVQEGGFDDIVYFRDEGQYPDVQHAKSQPANFPAKTGRDGRAQSANYPHSKKRISNSRKEQSIESTISHPGPSCIACFTVRSRRLQEEVGATPFAFI